MIPILATVLLTWALCMPLHFYGKKQKNKVLSLVFKALPTIMAAMFAGYAALFLPGSNLQHAVCQNHLVKGLDEKEGEAVVQKLLLHRLVLEGAGDEKGGKQKTVQPQEKSS